MFLHARPRGASDAQLAICCDVVVVSILWLVTTRHGWDFCWHNWFSDFPYLLGSCCPSDSPGDSFPGLRAIYMRFFLYLTGRTCLNFSFSTAYSVAFADNKNDGAQCFSPLFSIFHENKQFSPWSQKTWSRNTPGYQNSFRILQISCTRLSCTYPELVFGASSAACRALSCSTGENGKTMCASQWGRNLVHPRASCTASRVQE